jgi:hypothetical protein
MAGLERILYLVRLDPEERANGCWVEQTVRQFVSAHQRPGIRLPHRGNLGGLTALGANDHHKHEMDPETAHRQSTDHVTEPMGVNNNPRGPHDTDHDRDKRQEP